MKKDTQNTSKFIRKTYLIEEVMLQDMAKLKDHLRLTTETNVIRTAINLLWKDTFKYGSDPRLNISVDDSPETFAKKAKAKADAKIALKEAEEKAKLQPKIDMCQDLLKGEVVINEGGFKFCKFMQYTLSEDRECKIPISQVAPIIAETSLFVPSKESVLKRRPELKAKFK